MSTSVQSANERLRELVESSGLSSAVAMTIFNRNLGPAALPESEWKALFADPGSERFRSLSDELLAHAVEQFSRITQR